MWGQQEGRIYSNKEDRKTYGSQSCRDDPLSEEKDLIADKTGELVRAGTKIR